jgi:branched-chain amino acid transport system ATP-binding protein
MGPILEVRGLEKRFGGNRAVDGATFNVLPASITGLIGPNGAGKTTCFNCIAGALKPDGGRVVFDGEDITGWPSYRVYARGLARTFQIPQEFGGLSVLENLMLAPLEQSGERIWDSWLRPGRVAREERANIIRAREVLGIVELERLADDRSDSLSGGQRKLLELARVLMGRPRMILLDEPSAGVNPTLMHRLVQDIKQLRESLAITFLVVAHDMDLVTRLCDRLVVMTAGRVLTEGTPDEVLADHAVREAYLGSQYR